MILTNLLGLFFHVAPEFAIVPALVLYFTFDLAILHFEFVPSALDHAVAPALFSLFISELVIDPTLLS